MMGRAGLGYPEGTREDKQQTCKSEFAALHGRNWLIRSARGRVSSKRERNLTLIVLHLTPYGQLEGAPAGLLRSQPGGRCVLGCVLGVGVCGCAVWGCGRWGMCGVRGVCATLTPPSSRLATPSYLPRRWCSRWFWAAGGARSVGPGLRLGVGQAYPLKGRPFN